MPELDSTHLPHFGLALLLGLLVGIERERSENPIAGIRTFPLVTMLGVAVALLAEPFGGWTVGAGALGVTAMAVVAGIYRVRAGHPEPGLTTQAALLVMYSVGALVVVEGTWVLSVSVAICTAVLLHLKLQLHEFAGRLGAQEVRAMLQFAVAAFVVLPVLPDRDVGPFGVINAYEIWLMVVLIVSISLAGYVLFKLFGDRVGAALSAALGGLVSSTATTVSFSRRAGSDPEQAPVAALAVVVATAVLSLRVIVETAIIDADFSRLAAPRLGVLVFAAFGSAGVLWTRARRRTYSPEEQRNPTEFRTALVFAVLYAAVKLAVASANHYLGSEALFGVAVVSGLTDMDAITLSVSRLVHQGQLDEGTGWRLIVIASLSNLAFKYGTVVALGGSRLRRSVGAGFGAVAVAGALVLALG